MFRGGSKTDGERDRREEALANTLMRISSILRATGDGKQALEADRTALEMRRRLLDRKPDDVTRQRNVASSLTAPVRVYRCWGRLGVWNCGVRD